MKQERKNNYESSRSYNRDGRTFHGGSREKSFSEQREMHKATCTECNNSCEVPFKPTEGKPVYCRDCFRKRKGKF